MRLFLRAVTVQANDAVRRSERLVDLAEEFRQRLAESRSRAHELVDTILSSPVITTQRVTTELGVTATGATNLLRQMESVGILHPTQSVPGRSNRWIAREVRAALIEETPEAV